MASLAEKIAERLDAGGNRPLYAWVGRSCTVEKSLTGGEIAKAAQAEATRLRALLQRESLVGIAVHPGPEFLIGLIACFWAGMTAMPLPAPGPGPGRTRQRLQSALESLRPQAILTTAGHAATLARMAPEQESRLIVIGTAVSGRDGAIATAAETAILQLTSGTAGAAKGVCLSDAAILANIRLCRATSPSTGAWLSWLPHYHDLGLFGGLLYPLVNGLPITQMSPLIFLQQPFRWLKVMDSVGAAVTGAPAFALQLCIDMVTPEMVRTLDLSRLEGLFCGAEPIPPGLLQRFAETMAPAGLSPTAMTACYGLAENVVCVAGRQGDGP